jgi:hypothetical protein
MTTSTVMTWHSDYASAPAQDAYAITTSDSVNFSSPFRSIYVGGSGNIVVVTPSGTAITFNGALAGTVIPVAGLRVNTTSTTATNLVGLV